MPNYPTSLDTLTNPTSADGLSSPPHATQHTDANDIVEALEAKVGIGASTPTTAGHVLTVTGAGVTAWQAATGAIATATVTLTNAQIKALPTTPVAVLAAGGAGTILNPVSAVLHLDWTANYANVAGTAFLAIEYDTSFVSALALLDEESFSSVSGLLAVGEDAVASMSSHSKASGLSTFGTYKLAGDVVNQGLMIRIFNVGAGALTGGNAANTLKVTVLYSVIDV